MTAVLASALLATVGILAAAFFSLRTELRETNQRITDLDRRTTEGLTEVRLEVAGVRQDLALAVQRLDEHVSDRDLHRSTSA